MCNLYICMYIVRKYCIYYIHIHDLQSPNNTSSWGRIRRRGVISIYKYVCMYIPTNSHRVVLKLCCVPTIHVSCFCCMGKERWREENALVRVERFWILGVLYLPFEMTATHPFSVVYFFFFSFLVNFWLHIFSVVLGVSQWRLVNCLLVLRKKNKTKHSEIRKCLMLLLLLLAVKLQCNVCYL